jgi:hypothetical protein
MVHLSLRHVIVIVLLALSSFLASLSILHHQIRAAPFEGMSFKILPSGDKPEPAQGAAGADGQTQSATDKKKATELRVLPGPQPKTAPKPAEGQAVQEHAVPLPDLAESEEALTENQLFHHRHPAFLTWIMLIGITLSLAVTLGTVVVLHIGSMMRTNGIPPLRALLLLTLTVATGAALFYLAHRDAYLVPAAEWLQRLSLFLQHPAWTVRAILVVAFIPAIIALWGQLLVSAAVDRLAPGKDADAGAIAQLAGRFAQLRAALRFFLTSVAILVVMSVVTTDALRRALLNAVHAENLDIFPREFVYMYGFLFALVLAIFYLPVSFHLRARGRWLRDQLSSPGQPTTEETKAALQSLDAAESPLDNLKTAISILSPLITSFLPNLISLDLS